jgi:hypothetical protein
VPLSVSLFCFCIALSDVVRILEKALKIICENANLSAQLFLVLCGKVITLKRGFELENRASSHAQTARGRSELFSTLPGYSGICASNREGSVGILAAPHWKFFNTKVHPRQRSKVCAPGIISYPHWNFSRDWAAATVG